MKIGRAAGVTDTGRRRLRNEDAFICEPRSSPWPTAWGARGRARSQRVSQPLPWRRRGLGRAGPRAWQS